MYKLLLCWRYLRTRYLALLCIVSVMLGVATLIVVNAVMSGFSTKLKERMHGLLSDIVLESSDLNGFDDYQGKMERIRQDPYLRERIAAMSPMLECFAMLQVASGKANGSIRLVRLIGVEPESRAAVGGFKEFLQRPENREKPSFELGPEARKRQAELERVTQRGGIGLSDLHPESRKGDIPPPDLPPSEPHVSPGVIVGYALAYRRGRKVDASPAATTRDECLIEPGDDIILTTLSGAKLAPAFDRFAVCDYVKTGMSEYDSHYVYVSLEHLQKLRAMEGRVTSIQIKLKNYADAPEVTRRLRAMFEQDSSMELEHLLLTVKTWEEKQGPLLAAIRIEKGILNVLLFLIVAVAGFGILAIFSMIVVEKTRDIGILKALGASNTGVAKIFLGYGLLLGLVGSGLGTALGLTITDNVNAIEAALARLTGLEVFPRDIYYFDSIPTDVQPWNVVLVNLGAVGIAVLFSVLPALRAASLHPVRALRYE